MKKVNLTEVFGKFGDHWSPKIAGELNDFQVKLVKFKGPFRSIGTITTSRTSYSL